MRDGNKFQICQAAKYSDKLELLPADVGNQRDWLSMQQGRFRLDIRRNCLPMMIVNLVMLGGCESPSTEVFKNRLNDDLSGTVQMKQILTQNQGIWDGN